MDKFNVDEGEDLRLIPLDGEQAGEALTRLARNLPYDLPIGRPFAAAYDPQEDAVIFCVDSAFFWSYNAHATRLAPVGDDLVERTEWFGGGETERTVCALRDLRGYAGE